MMQDMQTKQRKFAASTFLLAGGMLLGGALFAVATADETPTPRDEAGHPILAGTLDWVGPEGWWRTVRSGRDQFQAAHRPRR